MTDIITLTELRFSYLRYIGKRSDYSACAVHNDSSLFDLLVSWNTALEQNRKRSGTERK